MPNLSRQRTGMINSFASLWYDIFILSSTWQKCNKNSKDFKNNAFLQPSKCMEKEKAAPKDCSIWYDQADKPSSVVCDNLSRQDVAALLQPPVGSAGPTITPQSVLHRIGFTWRRGLPRPGELLPRLSTLTGQSPAVSLCCTFPKVAFGCR